MIYSSICDDIGNDEHPYYRIVSTAQTLTKQKAEIREHAKAQRLVLLSWKRDDKGVYVEARACEVGEIPGEN